MATDNSNAFPRGTLCAELLAGQARLAAQLEDTKADLAFFILATAVLEALAIVGILLRAST